MRDIKFRGKHKNPYGDKWVHGYYALEDGEHVIIMPHSISYEEALKENREIPPISVKHTIDYNTIGQYTGLKDKNGKEIYEGDIVKSILILLDGTALKTNIDVVEWNEIDCSFMLGKGLRHFNEHLILEVIGNIYDNPDLLEKGAEE